MTRPLNSRTAREAAGLSPQEAARRARVSIRYLLETERTGAPYVLALRLSAIYGAPIDCFIFRAEQRSDAGGRSLPSKKGPRPESQPAGGSTDEKAGPAP